MNLYEILLRTHSGIRWLVLAVAIIAILKLMMTWLQKGSFNKMDNGLTRGFVGLLDLQMLLGLSLIIWFALNASVSRLQIEHAVTNVIAITIVHIGAKKWKNAPGPIRARNTMLTFVAAFLLIGVGIFRLLGGFVR